MRKCCANFEIGPALLKPIAGLVCSDVDSVAIDAVDLRQRLNEINGVAFVAPKLRPNSMRVDCDPQPVSPVLILAGSRGAPADLFAFTCSGSLGSLRLMSARIALADACSLTSQSAQVVEFCPADATSFDEIDVIDNRSVKWEDSLNTNAETRFSHGDGFTRAAMFASYDDTFKSLQSFFGLGFLN